MGFSDLTPENTITNASGTVLGVDGSPLHVTSTSDNPMSIILEGLATDVAGRIKVSQPHDLYTLTAADYFDQTRYYDVSTSGSGAATYDSTEKVIDFS